MTAGNRVGHPNASQGQHNQTSRQWVEHSSGKRVNTDVVIVDSLRSEYPQLHVSMATMRASRMSHVVTLTD